MTIKDAHAILMQAMQTALASGLFKDFQSVNVVQEALQTLNPEKANSGSGQIAPVSEKVN